MTMSRQEKEILVADIKDKLSAAKMVILTDFKGLNVKQVSDLRNRLRGEKVDYRVLKNTLTLRAVENTEYADLTGYLSGPTAWALGYEDSMDLPKLLVEFSKRQPNLKIKAGMYSSNLLEADDIRMIAELPPREVLIAKLLGTLQSPIAGLVGVLGGPMRGLLTALNAVKEQKEKAS